MGVAKGLADKIGQGGAVKCSEGYQEQSRRAVVLGPSCPDRKSVV